MGFRGLGRDSGVTEVVVRRFDGVFNLPSYATPAWRVAHRGELRRALVLDTETTGLEAHTDRVIEIAMREFEFVKATGEVVAIGEMYTALQDPGMPLPELTKRITGLTDSDVHGQRIDQARVAAMLDASALVIAHNAVFDRPFVDAMLDAAGVQRAKKTHWACSLSQIDWDSKDMPAKSLEVLCVFHGFFSAMHRAAADIDALLHLLSMRDVDTDKPYLDGLLRAARERVGKVDAVGSPFESKDALKARGYSWDAARRVWWKIIRSRDWKDEETWLSKAVYRGVCAATFADIAPEDRFKHSGT